MERKKLSSKQNKINLVKNKSYKNRIKNLEAQLLVRVSTIQSLAGRIKKLRNKIIKKDVEINSLKGSHQQLAGLRDEVKGYNMLDRQYEENKKIHDEKNRMISELENKLNREVYFSKYLKGEMQGLKDLMQSQAHEINSLKDSRQQLAVLRDEVKGYNMLDKQSEENKKIHDEKNRVISELENKLNRGVYFSKYLKGEIQGLKDSMQLQAHEINSLKDSRQQLAVLKDEIKGYNMLIRQYKEDNDRLKGKNRLILGLENKANREVSLSKDLKGEIQELKDLMKSNIDQINSLSKSQKQLASLKDEVEGYNKLTKQYKDDKERFNEKNLVVSELENKTNREVYLLKDLKGEIQELKDLMRFNFNQSNSLRKSQQQLASLKDEVEGYNELTKQYKNDKERFDEKKLVISESKNKRNREVSLSENSQTMPLDLKSNSFKELPKTLESILGEKRLVQNIANLAIKDSKEHIERREIEIKDDKENHIGWEMKTSKISLNKKTPTSKEFININDNLQKAVSVKDEIKKTKLSGLIKVKTKGGSLLIRGDAALESPIIGKLDNGTIVPVTKKTKNWYQIEYNHGELGWVNGGYVEFIDDRVFQEIGFLGGP